MPPRKKNSRTELQTYHQVLGNLPRLVKRTEEPAAQENLDIKSFLAGSRRSADKKNILLRVLWDTFSEREQDVTILVCEGMTDAEIAGRLYIGAATVKTYLQRIFYKANVRDRRELMRMFIGFNFQRGNPQA